jgi:hypothetical protein
MKKVKPDFSSEIIKLNKTLTMVYQKGRIAGLKEALKPFTKIKDKGVSN